MTQSSAAEESNSPVSVATPKTTLMQGVTSWKNTGNKFLVIDLEHIADPDKRSAEWVADARAGAVSFDREYGPQWTVYEGKRVYANYQEPRHLIKGTIMAERKMRLLSGWDAGPNDVNLAWSLALVNPAGPFIRFIDEYYVDDGDAADFLQVVGARLRLEWYKLGGFSIHIADQSVFTKTNIEAKSFADLMRQHGFYPIPGEISFVKRRKSVDDLLKTYDSFKVHERCVLIREALSGGYVYPKVMGGVGGMYKETPLKNKFSHIANTIEYTCSRINVAERHVPYEGRSLPRVSIV